MDDDDATFRRANTPSAGPFPGMQALTQGGTAQPGAH
jgi:hypothetical protein